MNYGYLFGVLNSLKVSDRNHLQLIHNLIYEMTLLRIDHEKLKDGYQVLLNRLEQQQKRERELEKILMESNGKK